MILLFLWCFAGDAGRLDLLEIPGFMTKPQARWQDLNGDGRLDIWVSDGTEQVWVWDGASAEARFRRLPFEAISLEVRPLWSEGSFRAGVWLDGRYLAFQEGTGWSAGEGGAALSGTRPGLARPGLARPGLTRPGLDPITFGPNLLVPSFGGYRLMEGNCQVAFLPALPANHLQARRLRLIYPIPTARDLDRDGRDDLVAAPVSLPRSGELRVWRALRTESGWDAGWQVLQFPHNLGVKAHQFGDLDGDGFDDLVVIAAPEQEMSLFEEMAFMAYMGQGHGVWENRASQVLKTQQNLWQTGPVEVGRDGITLYYYKGLIRTIFKIDRYRWDAGGFIRPKPESVKWTQKDGSRSTILTGHDLNGDGWSDLVLAGQGIFIHYRRPDRALPFDEKPDRVLAGGDDRKFTVDVTLGEESFSPELTARINQESIRREGRLALVSGRPGEKAGIWTMFEGMNGFWYLKRLD